MKRDVRRGLWLAALALGSIPWIAALWPQVRSMRGALGTRLLGPLAPLCAQWQWLRFDRQVWHGDVDRALALGRSAIELDPRTESGWLRLASHMGLDRGSAERCADAQERVAWVQAALALAREGESRVRHPTALALFQAALLGQLSAEDPAFPWPGGPPALAQAARAAVERAQALTESR